LTSPCSGFGYGIRLCKGVLTDIPNPMFVDEGLSAIHYEPEELIKFEPFRRVSLLHVSRRGDRFLIGRFAASFNCQPHLSADSDQGLPIGVQPKTPA